MSSMRRPLRPEIAARVEELDRAPGGIARPGDLWSFSDKDGDMITVERRDDVVSIDIESGKSGDDLMVWVPLDKALELARAIQAAAGRP